MIDQNLLDYIKQTREKGYQDKIIHKAMLKQGYSEDAVKEAFELSEPISEPVHTGRIFNRKILAAAIVLVVVCVSVLFISPISKTGFASQIKPLGEDVYNSAEKECRLDIKLNIIDMNGDKKICYEKTRNGYTLQFLIENLGNTEVDGLKVVIVTNDAVYEKEVPDSKIPLDQVKSVFVEYDDDAKITKVKIYPVVKNLLGAARACSDTMISARDIKMC